MEGKIRTYKDLIAWQKAIDLVTLIYSTTNTFPEAERFGIVSQLKRAVVAIPSNIAEGWGRESSKNYLQFLRISRGSLMEVETLLIISKNLDYIDEKKFETLADKVEEAGRIIQGLIKGIQQRIKLTED